jgi:hypothetical protein
LQRRFLVDGEYTLVSAELTRVQVAQRHHLRAERFVARHLRGKPVMHAPRLELVRPQDALDRRERSTKEGCVVQPIEKTQLFDGTPRPNLTSSVRQKAISFRGLARQRIFMAPLFWIAP